MEHSLAKQFPLKTVSVAAKKEDKFMGPKASRLMREAVTQRKALALGYHQWSVLISASPEEVPSQTLAATKILVFPT